MRKIFAIPVALLLVGVAVGGCAQLQQLQNGISLATKSYNNPVTKDDLAKAETVIDGAISLLNTYKQGCKQGTVDTNCRANVAAIQVYTRQMPPLLVQIRSFVKNNDQVNAINNFNDLVSLFNTFKSAAANVGINVGNGQIVSK